MSVDGIGLTIYSRKRDEDMTTSNIMRTMRTIQAWGCVLVAIILSLSVLLLSQSVGRAAKPPSTGDTTPPTVTTVAPPNGATGVAPATNVEATFSEAMIDLSINGSTFRVVQAVSGKLVEAQVTYDPATKKATLDPYADLGTATKYTATVKGGGGGVKDLAGNPMRNNVTWSFTTAPASPPPDTTPPDTAIDSGPSDTVNSSSASFTFSSTEPNSSFECKLDNALYSGCTSPKTYDGLADGSHTFYVKATDVAGNVDPTAASRTWTVDTSSPPPTPDKMIALTFDDGPDPADTPKILDVLRFHNVKATFFLPGREVNAYPDLVRREYQEGHMIGNHSYTHRALTTLSEDEVRQELQDTNTAITSAGVPQPKLFRPPYADTNATVEGVATSLGMTQTLWDFSEQIADHENPPPEELCDRAVRDAKPGAIMLLHDGDLANNTDDAIDCIITRLEAQGYGFGLIYPSSNYNSLNSSYVEIR